MISPGLEHELAQERECEIARRAGRHHSELLTDAAPAISVVVGIAALVALGLPVVP